MTYEKNINKIDCLSGRNVRPNKTSEENFRADGSIGSIAVRWIPQDEARNHEISATFAKDIKQFFETLGVGEDPVLRRDRFARMDEAGFLDLVGQTAGLLRTGRAEIQSFDGRNVRANKWHVDDTGATTFVGWQVFPDQREKEQLLGKTWRVAQEFLQDNSLEASRALLYAGLTVAGGVVLTHPFIDGNGRTSRILSYAIARGVANEEEIKHILAKDKSVWPVATPEYMTKDQPGTYAFNGDAFWKALAKAPDAFCANKLNEQRRQILAGEVEAFLAAMRDDEVFMLGVGWGGKRATAERADLPSIDVGLREFARSRSEYETYRKFANEKSRTDLTRREIWVVELAGLRAADGVHEPLI